ncbi:hypothetical protein [uncultured Jatrophihabitans sp.]|uniref:hypothetical protein n=1 Tax=uncultured Jatrophihabitans sp. TaxID=1610747 RepID=UPI0035CA5F02
MSDNSAELVKLARALDVPVERLAMVDGLSADELRAVRAQIGEALFQADRHHFSRVAALTRAVPTSVSAKLTEAVLPPLIAARTAELLEPKKAADLVARIKPSYLADVAAVMDPARSPEVVAAMPPELVVAVNVELIRREDWLVIGGFVAQVSDAALALSIAQLDGEQLLRVGYVLDDLSRMDVIGGLLTDGQIDDVLAAAGRHQLWPELAELLTHMTLPRVERITARLAVASKDVRDPIDAAAADGLLPADTVAALRLRAG